ncbi:MAG: hypothetical protein WBD36_10250 [Bacteroidota bacterium]
MANSRIIDIGKYLGYGVSAITFVFGLVVVSGLLLPERIPAQFRYTFGVVLMLMGVYRFVVTRTKAIRERNENE